MTSSAPEPRFRSLGRRAATAAALTAAIAWTIFAAPIWVFTLVTGGFICAGLYELLTMLRSRGVPVYRLFGVAVGAVIPLVVGLQLGSGRSGEVLFIVLACFGLFLLQFLRKNDPRALEGIALTLFGILYVSWFLSFAIRIRFLPDGGLLIAYLLTVTKGGDVGAYFGGTLFGRHTLVPHVSPRKTVEGTLAGIAASVALSLAFYDILPFDPGPWQLGLLGLLLALVAQCGDLSESLIKRSCGARDSGGGLPGFGGFLDLMDSALFTIPLFYFYLQTFGGAA
jgi:phosphatidate cytidylyltransferase